MRHLAALGFYWTGHFASKLFWGRFRFPGAFRYYQWAMGRSLALDMACRIWKENPE